MVNYLACLKRVRGHNDPACRDISKSYLKCRMDKYVVAPCTGLIGDSRSSRSMLTGLLAVI